MSSSIWTRCGGVTNSKRLSASPVRAVEAQHLISTRKLTDSDAEQALLEELLEPSKPPAGDDVERLHYLLFTPFRYPPLRHGSRFGTRRERGIWYGSDGVRTCFAEVAYYRLLFLEGTAASLAPLLMELTTFQASVRTRRGVDLTLPPFDKYRSRLSSPSRYDTSQALGAQMRADGIELFRYGSARHKGGTNIGLFSPGVFTSPAPSKLESWLCVVSPEHVEFSKKEHRRRRESYAYPRRAFEVKGKLPAPAV